MVVEDGTKVSKVYIINDSGHDYKEAEKYGELTYLTRGKVASYATNQHYRTFAEIMSDASPNDYILVTSLASMNLIAGWIIGILGFPLNMLLFKDNTYVVRRLMPHLILPTKKEEKNDQ